MSMQRKEIPWIEGAYYWIKEKDSDADPVVAKAVMDYQYATPSFISLEWIKQGNQRGFTVIEAKKFEILSRCLV